MRTSKELKTQIKNWVKKNYGKSELENPSWDIDSLVEELCQESNRQFAGVISVDSGTVMVADACYWLKGEDTMKWEDYCNELGNDMVHRFNHSTYINGKGITFTNFGGDGVFPVFVEYDDEGFQTKIIIDFEGE